MWKTQGTSSEKMSYASFKDLINHPICGLQPAVSLGIVSLNHSQGKPRAQCHLDKFPVPKFNWCPGQAGSQLLVTFCIPRAHGILIILKGKITTELFFQNAEFLGGIAETKGISGHKVKMPLDPPLPFSLGFLFLEACSLHCFD